MEEGRTNGGSPPMVGPSSARVRERLGDVGNWARRTLPEGARRAKKTHEPAPATIRHLFYSRGVWAGALGGALAGMVRVRRRQDGTPRDIVGASAWAKQQPEQQPTAGIPAIRVARYSTLLQSLLALKRSGLDAAKREREEKVWK